MEQKPPKQLEKRDQAVQPEVEEVKYDEVDDILAQLFPTRGKGNLLSAYNGLISIESLWKRLEPPPRVPESNLAQEGPQPVEM